MDEVSTNRNAVAVASEVTDLFLAFLTEVLPGAATISTAVKIALKRKIAKTQEILIEELKKGNFSALDSVQIEQFIPMGYRFWEAFKQGEAEHTLKILAAYLAQELGEAAPQAANFSRIARRLEGMTAPELETVARIQTFLDDPNNGLVSDTFVSATQLHAYLSRSHVVDVRQVAAHLAELSSRGFLVPDGASRVDKAEEYYYLTGAFHDLVKNARDFVAPNASSK